MNKPQHYYSRIIDGKLNKYVSMAIGVCLKAYEGHEVKITITEHKKQRTNAQNSFYRGFIVPAVRDFFFERGDNLTLDETHEIIVRHVWKFTKYVTMPNGTTEEIRRSSTEPDTVLWSTYQDITYEYFASKGLVLPIPEKQIPEYAA